MNKIPALITSLLLSSLSQVSSADEYILDPVHTQIIFFADHLGFSKSQGKFLDFNGHFSFEPSTPGSASAEVVINTASIEMNDA
ncbi:MAG: YceI family protein, partial [Pseudomonadota bacterium]